MISDQRPSHHGKRPFSNGGKGRSSNDNTLATEKIQIERKTFIFALKENPRGRFLRITEDVNGRRDSIIIPATGLEEFRQGLNNVIQAGENKESEPESE